MARTDQRIEALGCVELFCELTPRQLRTVLATCREWEFAAGEEITTQDTKGGRFYLILEGEADVEIDGEVKSHYGPNDYFGEMALLDGGVRSATVRATSPVRALGLASFNFLPLLREHPSIAERLLVTLSRRLRAAERPLV